MASSQSARERVIATNGVVGVLLAFPAIVLVAYLVGDSGPDTRRWTFTDVRPTPELGFQVPSERSGAWSVETDERATGGRAMVNRAGDANAEPATAIARSPARRDLRASTRCRMPEGSTSRACGLVFRYRDGENHYVARLDALAREISVVAVVAGRERALARVPADFTADVWQELAVEVRGGHIRVDWNGVSVIDAYDRTFSTGAAGLWTPASSVSHFDELSIESVHGSPRTTRRPLALAPIFG